ncbi:hypothetical protein SHKM778_49590 [Streptomyces sp. KM77-8]|uniref:LacI family transcriptional regulator n=1 Tax=Streptomyces haneummycinicus TaxID=3074435 RepID=A0AAT9HMW9_9ACTN
MDGRGPPGVVDTVEEAGFGLLLFTCNRGVESVGRFTRQVSAGAFDGLLAVEPEDTLSMLAALHREGLPVVLIDDRGRHPEFPTSPRRTTGRRRGRAPSAGRGPEHALVLTGPLRFGCVRDRLDGFANACADGGHPLDPALVVESDFTEADARESVTQLLGEDASSTPCSPTTTSPPSAHWRPCVPPACAYPTTWPSSASTTFPRPA